MAVIRNSASQEMHLLVIPRRLMPLDYIMHFNLPRMNETSVTKVETCFTSYIKTGSNGGKKLFLNSASHIPVVKLGRLSRD